MSQKVAFLGIGIMGAPMTCNLLRNNFRVAVWNRSRTKAEALCSYGSSVSHTPSMAAEDADVVILMLSDGPVCDAILMQEGEHGPPVLPAMKKGARLLVMSSIPVETARTQAAAAASLGIGYLDAPVSGGEPGAIAGTLAIMAGGAQKDYDAVLPVLEAMGRPTRVGEAGSGQLAKLANQMIVGNTLATIAEALIFAEQGGADPASVRAALLGGFADSTILKNHGQRMIEGNWKPGGFSRYQLKDLRTAMAFAETLGLALPVSERVTKLYEDTVAEGDGDLDQSAVHRTLSRKNDLDVR